jgi:D-alanyl-D-alanine dipeptidase
MALVSITPESHKVQIRLAYASSDNFTGRPVYARADCYLHQAAEILLRRAVDLAAAMGLGVLIFDAFRPSEAQWALWNHTPDPDFLADPRRGSPHSRGVAVDLTLTDEIGGGGSELDMGTEFDAFTPRSHHGSLEIGAEAQRNRAILMGIMTSAGWDFYRNEWWHYQMFDARRLYPVLSDSVLSRPMMPQTSLLAPLLAGAA